MTSAPAISIVMAVHNSEAYLRESLASMRWQTFTDWEFICVDDGSTDTTPQILADFAAEDSRFRIFRQEKSGIVAALTLGDNAARSNIIARMDSDDVAMPERLATQFTYLEEHPECVGVGANVLMIDSEGLPIDLVKYAPKHQEIEQRLLAQAGGTLAHPTLMMRRDAAVAAGDHRAQYPWAHDADLLMRLALQGKLANVPETLLLYRQHLKNSCTNRREEIRTELLSLLREQHKVRGLEMSQSLVNALLSTKRKSSMVGKWARRAARNGYYQTAGKLWLELIRQERYSIETIRITVEIILRGTVSLLIGQRGKLIETPDWKPWDCQPCTQKKAA